MTERYWTFRRSARASRRFAQDVSRLLRAGRVREAGEWCRAEGLAHSHLARTLVCGIDEWVSCEGRREGPGLDATLATVREAVQAAAALELADLKRGLSVLATIGSTAPFVGLFGTTFGIINAFSNMGQSGSGGLAIVSQGISEALITTALGLLVAVPAVWAYNYFAGRLERFGVEIDRGAFELVAFLSKQ
jgi:biopolymer transport protein ExbB/biopolymer transport protein TolQ